VASDQSGRSNPLPTPATDHRPLTTSHFPRYTHRSTWPSPPGTPPKNFRPLSPNDLRRFPPDNTAHPRTFRCRVGRGCHPERNRHQQGPSPMNAKPPNLRPRFQPSPCFRGRLMPAHPRPCSCPTRPPRPIRPTPSLRARPCLSVLLSLNYVFSSGDFPLSNLKSEIHFPRSLSYWCSLVSIRGSVFPLPSSLFVLSAPYVLSRPCGTLSPKPEDPIKSRKSMVQVTSNNVHNGPITSGIRPKRFRNVPRCCPLSLILPIYRPRTRNSPYM
jgi:hypothetical protein